jgi:hypothetical protein
MLPVGPLWLVLITYVSWATKEDQSEASEPLNGRLCKVKNSFESLLGFEGPAKGNIALTTFTKWGPCMSEESWNWDLLWVEGPILLRFTGNSVGVADRNYKANFWKVLYWKNQIIW